MRNDIRLNLIPNPYGNPSALVMTSATDNTAAFSWSPPKGTHPTITGYAWQYKKADDANWSALTTTTSTTASVSGLSTYTEYIFRVKTLYGNNESSYSILRFLTAVNLPYTIGFENGMPGWSEVDINTYYNVIYTGIYAEARHDGAYGYQFRCYEVNPKDQYLISPALPYDTSIDVSFYYRNHWSQSNETFQVGYSATRDITAFHWGDVITAENAEWKRYENTFPTGTQYIAVKYISNNYWFDLDDFEFVAHSDFAKPTDLSVDELGDQSVKLKWNGPSGATGYACQYKMADGDEWSAETAVSGSSFTLSGLTANTTYDFRVKALHSTGASNFVTVRFLTEGPMESLPHFQDFESGMGGWRVENGHGRTGITTREQHGGAYGFEFDDGSAQYLRSPLLEGDSPKILTFYAKPYTELTSETIVDITSADFTAGWSATPDISTGFQGVLTVDVTDYRWCRYSFQLPKEARYACIKAGINRINWLYVDDISISVITLPEAVEATVMGETKYVTTFYDGTRSWQLPEGTLAYQVSEDLVFYRIGAESDIIPAGMAVVIVSDKTAADTDTRKTINLTLTSTTDLHYYPVNILQGSDSAVAVSDGKIDGKTVYVLGIVDGILNFYPFSGSVIPAGKAYYLAE
ncbi:MAG: fibronectin type III domain-containing protein [Bacteroidales bacterium]|nr:fibronectin type III domain-containing protein [Bacteroidales bacterium]